MRGRDRKTLRLRGYDYTNAGYYFVTICVKERKCLLGDHIDNDVELSKIGEVARKCWLEIPVHFPKVSLDEFIIMPNHIHGIIIIHEMVDKKITGNKLVGNKNFCSLHRNEQIWQKRWGRSLSSVIRGFKIGVTSWCRQNHHEYFSWQKSFNDHIIRNERALCNIREYISLNPFTWKEDEYFQNRKRK
ncbi:MAG: hypothetical protein MRK01_04700 [Candidatus Scalindua sp.]|nr:hypothetical protein [Candidatus Scalindua sp.]